jgi:hypothetical protein
MSDVSIGLLATSVPQTPAIFFEPGPSCLERIGENIKLNGMSDAQGVALTDQSVSIKLRPRNHRSRGPVI